MTRQFVLLFICCIFGFTNCQNEKSEPQPDRPNVVLIMTDDQGWGDLSLHGNDSIFTPVLDAFAKESVRFERFYVSPVCAPTRASLLTGRYHPRTNVTGVTGRREVMRAEETTLAEILAVAGYKTGIFGKWHNGEQYPNDPNGQGFEEFFGFCAGHWNNYFDTQLQHNQEVVETKGFITDVLTDKAIDFITDNKNEPFFCYVPYNVPHSPMQVPDEYFEKYKKLGLTDFNAAAYAMCENMDANVGRILETLEMQGLDSNTIVIFTTDNGPNGDRYNGYMKGQKGSVDEGGVRVPLFVRWKGARLLHGLEVPDLAMHIDLLPTVLDLCEVPVPDSLQLDGRSLKPVLQGLKIAQPERELYTFSWGDPLRPQPGAVRTRQYRWVLNRDSSQSLYDMLEDPSQQNDIAAENPDLVAQLGSAYAKKFAEVTENGTAPLPIPVGYPKAPTVRLPAHEAQPAGNVGYKEGHGWANDWLVNWTATGDRASWALDVAKPGTYRVQLQYSVSQTDTGALIFAQSGEQKLTKLIQQAHDPDPLPSPDRVSRKEVYEKVWQTLDMGTMQLEAGRQELVIQLDEVPGAEAMELKGVILERQ